MKKIKVKPNKFIGDVLLYFHVDNFIMHRNVSLSSRKKYFLESYFISNLRAIQRTRMTIAEKVCYDYYQYNKKRT